MYHTKTYSTSPGERIVVYNSQDRYNVSDLSSKIDGQLDAPLKGVTRVTLHSVVIPHSWFNISPQLENQDFIIRIGIVDRTVHIDTGNYTYETFRAELESVLQFYVNLGVWTVEFDNVANGATSDSYRYWIKNTTQNWSIPAVAGTPTDPIPEAYKLLGLGASGLTGTANVRSTTGVICLNPIRTLFISHSQCKDLAANSSSPHFKSQFVVPVTSTFGGLTIYQMKEGSFNTVTLSGVDTLLSDFSIKLLDQDGSLVDLNGHDWTVCFLYTEQLRPNVKEEIDYSSSGLPPSKRQRYN
jgi:hypothetical protein